MGRNRYVICLLMLTLPACQQYKPEKLNSGKASSAALSPEPSEKEENAVNRVMSLPEMKQAGKEIQKGSKGKNHLAAYVETEPTAAEPYYWVKAGEDNGGSIVAGYMFTVNSKTGEIRYYDMTRDTMVTLAQWRKDNAVHH